MRVVAWEAAWWYAKSVFPTFLNIVHGLHVRLRASRETRLRRCANRPHRWNLCVPNLDAPRLARNQAALSANRVRTAVGDVEPRHFHRRHFVRMGTSFQRRREDLSALPNRWDGELVFRFRPYHRGMRLLHCWRSHHQATEFSLLPIHVHGGVAEHDRSVPSPCNSDCRLYCATRTGVIQPIPVYSRAADRGGEWRLDRDAAWHGQCTLS